MNTIDYATMSIAITSLIVALFSLHNSIRTYQFRVRQGQASTLFQVMERLETDEMRVIKHEIIYPFEGNNSGLSNSEVNQIQCWGAEMDIISLLVRNKIIDNEDFFRVYGDVIMRTAYRLAPFANSRRSSRGDQYWMEYQLLTVNILKIWRKQRQVGDYPQVIGLPNTEQQLTLEQLLGDPSFRRFLSANNVKLENI
ncbi:hypothetical protein [Candidatus Leptofilum sp.]|uniref:hypothetical protein n=1 Tax=Candidatus Leptofilum sp. TaxID=3241576 RepID=UPI003B593E6F